MKVRNTKSAKVKTPPFEPQTDEQVLRYALFKHATEYEKKFRAGMEKYRTPIWEKSGVDEAFPEVWDLLSYLALAKLQWSRMSRLLEALGDQYPAIKLSVHYKQAVALTAPKKLVVACKSSGVSRKSAVGAP